MARYPVITDRDIDIVRMLDETGGLDVRSIMAMFDLSQSIAYRRLLRLEEYEMIGAVRPFLRTPALYIPTERGLRELLEREDWDPPSVSTGSYNHQIQVARVIAQLHLHGVRWQASRVTRRHQLAAAHAGDHTAARRFGIKLSWLQRRHLSDVLIWHSQEAIDLDRPAAIEVELAQKTKSRLDEILLGYALSLDFAGVVYVCGSSTHAAPRRKDRDSQPKSRAQSPAHNAVLRAAERSVKAARPPGLVNVTTTDEFGPEFGPSPGARSQTWLDQYLPADGPCQLDEFFKHGPLAAPSDPGQGQLLTI